VPLQADCGSDSEASCLSLWSWSISCHVECFNLIASLLHSNICLRDRGYNIPTLVFCIREHDTSVSLCFCFRTRASTARRTRRGRTISDAETSPVPYTAASDSESGGSGSGGTCSAAVLGHGAPVAAPPSPSLRATLRSSSTSCRGPRTAAEGKGGRTAWPRRCGAVPVLSGPFAHSGRGGGRSPERSGAHPTGAGCWPGHGATSWTWSCCRVRRAARARQVSPRPCTRGNAAASTNSWTPRRRFRGAATRKYRASSRGGRRA
jgi:hypothetical protein